MSRSPYEPKLPPRDRTAELITEKQRANRQWPLPAAPPKSAVEALSACRMTGRETQPELLAVIRRESTGKTLIVVSVPHQAESDPRAQEIGAYPESQPLTPESSND